MIPIFPYISWFDFRSKGGGKEEEGVGKGLYPPILIFTLFPPSFYKRREGRKKEGTETDNPEEKRKEGRGTVCTLSLKPSFYTIPPLSFPLYGGKEKEKKKKKKKRERRNEN